MKATITRTDATDTDNVKETSYSYRGLLPELSVYVSRRREKLSPVTDRLEVVEPVFTLEGEETPVGPVIIDIGIELSFEEATLLSDALKLQLKAYRKMRAKELPKLKKHR
jgi:hypothetical protein